MPLLAEYAITPDVFDVASYSSEEVCGLRLDEIRRVMTEEGVVRDLRDGEWGRLFEDTRRSWHRRAKEIRWKLWKQGRLIPFPAELPNPPTNDQEWCEEALAVHRREPMEGGVIVTKAVKDAYRREPRVEQVDRLGRARWWTPGNLSVRPDRKLDDYRHHLSPLLRRANSLQFIDPYLDPAKRQYRRFHELLAVAGERSSAPEIEIHCAAYEGPGSERSFPDVQRIFRKKLAGPLRDAGLEAEVLLWDRFHDRYLLTNLMGIKMGVGFAVSDQPGDLTMLTRIGSSAHDDVQLEFAKGSGRHELKGCFRLP